MTHERPRLSANPSFPPYREYRDSGVEWLGKIGSSLFQVGRLNWSLPHTRWAMVMKFSVVRQPRARTLAACTSEFMASSIPLLTRE